jgi:8-oxo-dGTP pyrophosphatase MutT (NUDIX family)
MICRRHSFGYVEFVRVNFDLRDEPYIRQLMSEMTKDERAKLRVKPFRQLWTDLWQNTHTHPRYANEYARAEKRFEILRQSSLYRRLDRTIGTEWHQPEWGFPKGKRNREETSLACALREMHEETGIAPSARDAYRVFMADVSAHRVVARGRMDADAADADPHLHAAEAAGLAAPAVEMFQGTDGRKYRHVYFIAEADARHPAVTNVAVDPGDVLQTREVSELRWLTYEACLGRIRSYNVAKRALLGRVHPKVCAYAMGVGGGGAGYGPS